MVNCSKCDKALKTIGNSRKNGKSHDDWKERQFHKKCWKELKDHQNLIMFNNYFSDEEILKQLQDFKKRYNLTKLL